MAWGMVAVAGATLVGGAIAANGARSAANTQADATQAGIAEQQRQADRAYADQAPYRAAGVNALGQFANEIGAMPTAQEVMSQPGYQFGLQQGQQAIDRKASAAGGRISGASMKAAARFGTDYATSGYNAEYQRRQDRLNRLASLANLGQTATGASAASGQAAAGNIGSMLTSQGNAAAGAQMYQGQVWGNTANQLGALWQRSQTPAATPASSRYGYNDIPMQPGGGY